MHKQGNIPDRCQVPEFTVFASLLQMAIKYGFSDIREQLVDGIKGAYLTKLEDLGTGMVLGEDIFGSPKLHPNAVLNMFTEHRVKFALPFAACCAALGGFSSLISSKPSTVLPHLTLASTFYGMEVIWGRLAQLAPLVVCNINLERCHDMACATNAGVNPLVQRMEGLNKIYNAMVKEHKANVLFTPTLKNIVCVNCAKTAEAAYQFWWEMTWEKLPHIFGAGTTWEEVWLRVVRSVPFPDLLFPLHVHSDLHSWCIHAWT
jgi:hypothetical protein